MVAELLEKYIWLVQTLTRSGERGLTLEEIRDKWESRFGYEYARRSFNNHKKAIEEIFNIHISCNRSNNRYFIAAAEELEDGRSESSWLINTFTVNNVLSLSKEKLSGRVSVEDIPSGQKFLTTVMDAMMDNHELSIVYRKYSSEEAESLTVRPYAVKEDAKRWYLVGYCLERKGLRIYALDRIQEMHPEERKFRMPVNFDVDELFATSFGTYISELKPRLITFKTTMKQAHYLRDLPIHPTQKEERIEEDSVIFTIFVSPTTNLIMEFCKYGGELELLSPAEVRQRVADSLAAASSLYEKHKLK